MSDFILVPVDGSEHAQRAVDFAVKLAKGLNAELQLLAVLDLGQLEFYEGFYLNEEQLMDWQEAVKRESLAAALDRIPHDVVANARVEEGRAAPSILKVIKADKPICVVLGRQGKGAVQAALQGSVSQRVVKLSSVPVVVVN